MTTTLLDWETARAIAFDILAAECGCEPEAFQGEKARVFQAREYNGKPVENKFRFENEPARHKILDMLGDLALLNTELKAHIVGVKSGHSLNTKLLRKLEGVV